MKHLTKGPDWPRSWSNLATTLASETLPVQAQFNK